MLDNLEQRAILKVKRFNAIHMAIRERTDALNCNFSFDQINYIACKVWQNLNDVDELKCEELDNA